MLKNFFLVLTLSISLFSCKKNDKDSPIATTEITKQNEKNIIASLGGNLTTSDSVKLIIPPNAFPIDGPAFVGRTGQENTSVPNKQLQVIGSPITIRMSADTLLRSVQLMYQLPSNLSDPENYLVFIYNGSTYYPVERTINGKTVNVSIDVINWEAKSNKKAGTLTAIICFGIYVKQTPSIDQMGLKEVTFNNGTMKFDKPQNIGSSSKVIVLIHGWIGSPDGWKILMQKIQNERNPSYTNYLTFGYNSSMSIEENAQTLKSSLDVYAKGAKIDIIAHSMGGLVARSAIEHYGGSQSIRRLITLGTPHLGSPIAAIRYIIGIIVGLDSGLAGYMIYDYTTQGLRDLYTKSNYITTMMNLKMPPIPYYLIAATNDDSSPFNGSQFIEGPDDGVVAVTSAFGVPGADSPPFGSYYIQAAMAHTQMPDNDGIYNFIINYLKEPVVKPTISTTSSPISITAFSAQSGGTVVSDGGANLTARGVCWSKTIPPTTFDDKTIDGTGLGDYKSDITRLSPNTIYYLSAYATNSAGTGYGPILSFKTLPSQPQVTSLLCSNITSVSATCGGIIDSEGGEIIAKGVCWSTSIDPTINDNKTIDGVGAGDFISSITGLTPNTAYYIRAYATTTAGTGYGNSIGIKTLPLTQFQIPSLTTTVANSITTTSVVSGGNITSDGGATVTAKGICWSTIANPTTTNNKTSDGTGTGAYSSSITGLSPNTTYYARAYAINSAGTAYGTQITFTTNTLQIQLPSLTTTAATSITTTSAVSGGNIASDGGATVTAKGICWSTSANPTISNAKTNEGTGTGEYSSNLTGLSPNTKYYIRSYATNSSGTAYGNQIEITTLVVASIPTLTTKQASSITISKAISGGNISSDGGSPITKRGVCWNTSANPTTANSNGYYETGPDDFTFEISGLGSNVTYYVRAFATNSVGTAYGNQISFTTNAQSLSIPTLSTAAVTSINSTSATSGGNITSDGGALVTSRGICWSTSVNPTISNSKTTNGTGTGSFSSSITGLTAGTTYYVRAFATNSQGTGYGNQQTLVTPNAIENGTVTDIDGNVYNTVKIGNQWWMAENLKTTKFRNGDPVLNAADNSTWEGLSTGAYCNFNNDVMNVNTYGRLYNWYAIIDSRNIAPVGWHVASDQEWTTLSNFLGGDLLAGGKLKEVGIAHWWSPNTGATNESGFNALPAAGRNYVGGFSSIGYVGNWWSSSENNSDTALYWRIGNSASNIYRSYTNKKDGYSIRCVRDY